MSQEWFSHNNGADTGGNGTKMDYLHISVQDYGAPSLEELDYVVNNISQQIDRIRPIIVHCSGGKGRTVTILAVYLIKKENGMSADKDISKLKRIRGESIQSKDQVKIVFNYEKYIKEKQDKKSNY